MWKRSGMDLTGVDDHFKNRFWSKVEIGAPDECWPWLRYCKPGGYGQFTLRKGVFVTASRVALALTAGPLAANEVACHHCDNPPCCNPNHLFIGTQSDNMLDCIEKGRANRVSGTRHPCAKLTEDAVRSIRSTEVRFGTKSRLAREHGVDFHQIDAVLKGIAWRDVA